MTRNAHTPCDEPGCDRSPAKGDVLQRVNPKGQRGIFKCPEHANANGVTVLPPTVKQAGDPRNPDATWTLLPPDPEVCSQCASDHHPNDAHNQQSLHYQYAFYAEHKRWPTWDDAIAHCPPELQALWRKELRKRGAKVSDA